MYGHSHFRGFPADTQRGDGVELVMMVSNLEDTYAKAVTLDSVVDRLRLRPWGLHDFRLVDPAGFYIRFTEVHAVTDPTFAAE